MQNGSPKFSGYIRRLVDEGFLSAQQMKDALSNAQKNKVSIVAYLSEKLNITPLIIAEMISQEFGEPIFDLDSFNPEMLPKELIDPNLVSKHKVIPLVQRGNILYVATSDPTNIEALDAIRFNCGLNIEPIIVEHHKLEKYLEKHFTVEESFNFGDEDFDVDIIATDDNPPSEDDDEASEEEAPIVKYINKLLVDAIRMGASDLHFEPYEKSYRVRYRVDGVLRTITNPPLQLASRLASRLKVMSRMDISEKRVPQDGRIKLKLSKTKAIDFRVNSLPTLFGEKLVLRILDPSSAMLGIDALGYEEKQKALFMEALEKPQGMLLITGPTGSGKTVSLYTGLNILNTESSNISTAEDPVEINLEGINQVNVNLKAGLSFSVALKSFLRQDPDIIMVGEIRDLETAEIAIKAAQTGHMVMSTLHTNSAPETLTRLRNMGVPSFNIATSVNLVIAQRLARRLCNHCKAPVEIPRQSLLEMGFTEQDLSNPDLQIFQPVGCSECREGYKGRVGIYEVMKVTPEISKIIMEDGNALQIAAASEKLGFDNLRRSGLIKVINGLTSLQEINRVTSE
ncbi:type IV pilus assembly protein PilB [Acinetobacter sp. BIGb0196]|uniref:Type IV-A pilus assembly ATPase PilB n=2 Tax=Moraxellaceae TaxID=468 RepID=N8YF87_ACIGI|nr:type IV-A pilus assembly ATPase PilB [Acinetobacter guillouiae NIPH 991]MCS4298513.1 type IV pilus assembly protein PilB [Acinetobacter guillouiae]MCW2252117.1 type IV pilus assembly protein PilB [Acinetobacter sp. BIGb0204]NII38177.1 type IV pilus assembly protein PilB [Acinetobacter sp. BIGb0196]